MVQEQFLHCTINVCMYSQVEQPLCVNTVPRVLRSVIFSKEIAQTRKKWPQCNYCLQSQTEYLKLKQTI